MIICRKYDEGDSREYSIELEECLEDNVFYMLDMFNVEDGLSFADLEKWDEEGNLNKPPKYLTSRSCCKTAPMSGY